MEKCYLLDSNSLVTYSTARTVLGRAHENLLLLVRRCVLSLRIPVFNLMEDSFTLTLANPSFIKTFPGNKTDRRDAKWLAELHRLGLVQPRFIPPKHIRELRDLTRYRHKLVRARSAEKSRIHNILTVCNLMLSSVATDIFGKSGMNIMKALLQSKSLDEELLSDLILSKLREKIPQLILASQGTTD